MPLTRVKGSSIEDGSLTLDDIDLSSITTDTVSEGSNLYFTTARANTAIDNRVTKSFVDALNVDADTLDGANGAFYLDYNNFINTPASGDDVTLAGSYDYLTITDQQITLNQIDYTTDISNLPTLYTTANANTDIDARVTKSFVDALNVDADTLDGTQLTTIVSNYESYTDTAIAALANSAPATLDTLNELAAALGDDPNFATTVTNSIATKLGATATVTLTGDVSGSASFSANTVSITTTIADDSHNHVISNIDGLQTALDGKLSLTGGTLTGTVTATAFSGDGSGLSNVNAATLDSLDSTQFLRSDAADTASGRITFTGGIDGFTLSQGISGNNFNITGVNQLTISDPGEGILFTGTTSVTLAAIDDATDSIMNFYNASELRVNNNKVWTTANDGSGSGLDADLLDGQHGSYYMPATSTTFPADAADKADITTRTDSGFYNHGSAATADGWPINTGWMHLLATTHSNDSNYYSMQIAGSFYNNVDVYYRATNGSGTTAWAKMWNSANDGAGSGLDADTVDGIQASQFLRSDTSDSMSGDLTLGGTVTFNSAQYVNSGIDYNHPTSGSANLNWEDDYLRYRFGGTSTPQGIRIDNYDTVGIELKRGGDATFNGTVTATAFSGDGSGLTNLPASGVTTGKAIAMAIVFG